MQKKLLKYQAPIFVVLVYLISWIEQTNTIRNGHSQNSIDGFLLMWTPGLVAIFLSLTLNKNIDTLAFKRPDLKSLALAYFVPFIAAVFVIVLLNIFKISELQVSPSAIEKAGNVNSVLFKAFIFAPTVGMIIPFISGFGEEIGWRGFLHSHLLNLAPLKRYLITGVVWSVWHWPLILFGTYATSEKPWLSLILFTIAQTSSSFLFGYLRDRSKSVFPAALMHAAHNMWFLGISPTFLKPGPLAPYFTSESGVFCALIYFAIAMLIIFKLPNKLTSK